MGTSWNIYKGGIVQQAIFDCWRVLVLMLYLYLEAEVSARLVSGQN